MKYTVGEVQDTSEGAGFNILKNRAPIVGFGYLNRTAAVDARALIEKAIADAVIIIPQKVPGGA